MKQDPRAFRLRVLAAFAAGAVAGAALLTFILLEPPFIRRWLWVVSAAPVARPGEIAAFFGVVAAAVLVGLVAVAGPIWWLLYRWRRTQWWYAVLAGGTLAFALCLGAEIFSHWPPRGTLFVWDAGGATFEDGSITPHGWESALHGASVAGFVGLAVGLVMWLVAYAPIPSRAGDGVVRTHSRGGLIAMRVASWVLLGVFAIAIASLVPYFAGTGFVFDPRGEVASARLVSSGGDERSLLHFGPFYGGVVTATGDLEITCRGGKKTGDYVTPHLNSWAEVHEGCRLLPLSRGPQRATEEPAR